MRRILASRAVGAGLCVLALASAALAAGLEVGQTVVAEWSGGGFFEATVKSVAGGSAVVAWKDGSEPSSVALERVLPVPKAGEKPTAAAGALGFCKWESGTQWWDCRVTAVGANGFTVSYLSDGTVGDVAGDGLLIPTGKVAEELAGRAQGGGSSGGEAASGSSGTSSDSNAGFDPTLRNNDSDTYEYDLECGGSSTHSSISGSTTTTLSKGCKLKMLGAEIELKGNMACEIRSGSVSCN